MFCEVRKLPDLEAKSLIPGLPFTFESHSTSPQLLILLLFQSMCLLLTTDFLFSLAAIAHVAACIHSLLFTGVWMHKLWAVSCAHCRLRGLSVSQFCCVSLQYQSVCIDLLGQYWVHWTRSIRSKLRPFLFASPSFFLCLWITVYRCNCSTLCAQGRWAFSPLPKAQSPSCQISCAQYLFLQGKHTLMLVH